KKQSSNSLIKDVEINLDLFLVWKNKFYKTLEQAYSKAPFFNSCFEIIENTIENANQKIGELAKNSIKNICQYLDIPSELKWTSTTYENSNLKASERVVDICKMENAKVYINPIGGMDLYNKEEFNLNFLNLYFIKSSG